MDNDKDMSTHLIPHTLLSAGLGLSLLCLASASEPEPGFVPLFDGQTLKGWHPSAQTGHSAASQHKTGGRWVVEQGAIVGSQDIPGNGGILLTDEKFGDFEVALEMNNDFGPDSGLFMRSTEDGTAYQALVDYHTGGSLMGVYGEGKLGGKPSIANFHFQDQVTQIKLNPAAPFPCPVLPQSWPSFWRHGQWNELRARIVNNPPTITTWINGVQFMQWTETQKRHPDEGSIAVQVHGGGDFTKQYVRYRNIRVKRLAPGSAAAAGERLYEMRVYYAAPGKLEDLAARFRKYTLGLFAKHGMENLGYFIPIENPERKLVYFLAHANREAREKSFKAFGADPEWSKVVKETEANGRLVEKADVVFLKATDFSPAIHPAVGSEARVFEMRTYKCGPGRLPHLLARFRDHTVALFAKYGMQNIAYWTPVEAKDGADDTLIYILAHKSKEAAAASFDQFRADPAWVAARKASEEKAGGSLTLTNGVKSVFMAPTDFSPMR